MPATPSSCSTDSEAADEVRQPVDNIQGIVPSSVQVKGEKDGRAYMEGTLAAAPDSSAAFDTVDRVRDAVHDIDGASAIVGGNTAVNQRHAGRLGGRQPADHPDRPASRCS